MSERGEDPELAVLLDRARRGHARSFDAIARRVHDRVRGWARRLTRDADDAEDVAQLVLLTLHERLGDFDGRSRFTTWLYRVTRNVALDRRRAEARRAELLSRRAPEAESEGAVAADADEARLARLVRAYFEELPARQREIFELADLRGYTAPEIAARLGVQAATVRVTLLRARRAIRSRMLREHRRLLEEYTE
jgi:RNA polymerase sigma-70 factor (ECF subfamily)